MIPEWIWILAVGGIIVGLIKTLWSQRNKGYIKAEEHRKLSEEQGFLTAEKHVELCGRMRGEVSMDIDKIIKSFESALNLHSSSIQLLLNAKFESLDDKIENKVLKGLRLLGNGNGHTKSKILKKKR
jgi:hypothetical protein